jgi:hypothetical protein
MKLQTIFSEESPEKVWFWNLVRSNSTILQDLGGEGNDGVIISNPAMKP